MALRAWVFWMLILLGLTGDVAMAAAPAEVPFPKALEEYHDNAIPGIWGKLVSRAKADPLNVFATVIFVLAIAHTFAASKFRELGHRYQDLFEKSEHLDRSEDEVGARRRDRLQLWAIKLHFLGEVEAIFGIWLIPLGIAIIAVHGFHGLVAYVENTQFTEPIFVVIIMAMAASRPVIDFARVCLSRVAALGNRTPAAWWVSILTIGPILGSFITEPAAMTVCALLLGERFFCLPMSRKLKYGTIGLLFVNISVGGTLTHFAAPPVVMVASKWGWGMAYMLQHFGWKAAVGILLNVAIYFTFFRKELLTLTMDESCRSIRRRPVPVWITVTHLLFLAWTVLAAHYPSLLVFGFLLFMAFCEATERHQSAIRIRPALLVGFFLASLVVHGGCQKWWIAPVLSSLAEWPLMIGSALLTAFNDNAAITYLASLVPNLSPELKYAVMAGAVTGGGLTVIANAPNPAGQALLQKYFGDEGVAPVPLLLGALVPTFVVGACYMLLP